MQNFPRKEDTHTHTHMLTYTHTLRDNPVYTSNSRLKSVSWTFDVVKPRWEK